MLRLLMVFLGCGVLALCSCDDGPDSFGTLHLPPVPSSFTINVEVLTPDSLLVEATGSLAPFWRAKAIRHADGAVTFGLEPVLASWNPEMRRLIPNRYNIVFYRYVVSTCDSLYDNFGQVYVSVSSGTYLLVLKTIKLVNCKKISVRAQTE